jgi:outer membrane lipoprotein SlyB
MTTTVSTDLLLRVAQATPEQQAAIERVVYGAEAKEEPAATAARSARVPGGLAGKAVAGTAEDPAGGLDCKSALAEILRRIGAIAEGLQGLQQENGQLRNAKARLEQIVAQGLLKFLARVDAHSTVNRR